MMNENLAKNENENFDDSFDYEELEKILTDDLSESMSELELLKDEKNKIGNYNNLGNTIGNVVWEQFKNQVAIVAGEDFIKENNGLTLDLRDEAHIQTTENFANGKIASHNTEIDYQGRYDNWQSKFQKDDNGKIIMQKDRRSGEMKAKLNTNARDVFDKNRPQGSGSKAMDHTVSAAEQIRDPEAYGHLDEKEIVSFANSDKNLNEMDSAANSSKGDSKMEEWLESEREGKKPAERFDIDEKQLREKDKEARKEYKKVKEEGKKKSKELGRESQKQEAFRIGGQALRAAIMALLMDLVRRIIQKLIKWFKETKKKLDSLIEYLKESIKDFVSNLKETLFTAGSMVATTVLTSIFGPIVNTLKKVWIMLKQGAKSVKEAIDYINDDNNKNKSIDVLMFEIGKIVIAGLTGVAAIGLGDLIANGLNAIPVFAIPIPLLGPLSSIIGIFLGAVVAGIVGAIILDLIDRAIAKERKYSLISREIEKNAEIIKKQNVILKISEEKLINDKKIIANEMTNRHNEMLEYMKDVVEEMNDINIQKFEEDNNEAFDRIMKKLNDTEVNNEK